MALLGIIRVWQRIISREDTSSIHTSSYSETERTLHFCLIFSIYSVTSETKHAASCGLLSIKRPVSSTTRSFSAKSCISSNNPQYRSTRNTIYPIAVTRVIPFLRMPTNRIYRGTLHRGYFPPRLPSPTLWVALPINNLQCLLFSNDCLLLYARTQVRMHILMHTNIQACVYKYVHIYEYAWLCLCVCLRAHARIYMCVCVNMRSHVQMHAFTSIKKHACKIISARPATPLQQPNIFLFPIRYFPNKLLSPIYQYINIRLQLRFTFPDQTQPTLR